MSKKKIARLKLWAIVGVLVLLCAVAGGIAYIHLDNLGFYNLLNWRQWGYLPPQNATLLFDDLKRWLPEQRSTLSETTEKPPIPGEKSESLQLVRFTNVKIGEFPLLIRSCRSELTGGKVSFITLDGIKLQGGLSSESGKVLFNGRPVGELVSAVKNFGRNLREVMNLGGEIIIRKVLIDFELPGVDDPFQLELSAQFKREGDALNGRITWHCAAGAGAVDLWWDGEDNLTLNLPYPLKFSPKLLTAAAGAFGIHKSCLPELPEQYLEKMTFADGEWLLEGGVAAGGCRWRGEWGKNKTLQLKNFEYSPGVLFDELLLTLGKDETIKFSGKIVNSNKTSDLGAITVAGELNVARQVIGMTLKMQNWQGRFFELSTPWGTVGLAGETLEAELIRNSIGIKLTARGRLERFKLQNVAYSLNGEQLNGEITLQMQNAAANQLRWGNVEFAGNLYGERLAWQDKNSIWSGENFELRLADGKSPRSIFNAAHLIHNSGVTLSNVSGSFDVKQDPLAGRYQLNGALRADSGKLDNGLAKLVLGECSGKWTGAWERKNPGMPFELKEIKSRLQSASAANSVLTLNGVMLAAEYQNLPGALWNYRYQLDRVRFSRLGEELLFQAVSGDFKVDEILKVALEGNLTFERGLFKNAELDAVLGKSDWQLGVDLEEGTTAVDLKLKHSRGENKLQFQNMQSLLALQSCSFRGEFQDIGKSSLKLGEADFNLSGSGFKVTDKNGAALGGGNNWTWRQKWTMDNLTSRLMLEKFQLTRGQVSFSGEKLELAENNGFRELSGVGVNCKIGDNASGYFEKFVMPGGNSGTLKIGKLSGVLELQLTPDLQRILLHGNSALQYGGGSGIKANYLGDLAFNGELNGFSDGKLNFSFFSGKRESNAPGVLRLTDLYSGGWKNIGAEELEVTLRGKLNLTPESVLCESRGSFSAGYLTAGNVKMSGVAGNFAFDEEKVKLEKVSAGDLSIDKLNFNNALFFGAVTDKTLQINGFYGDFCGGSLMLSHPEEWIFEQAGSLDFSYKTADFPELLLHLTGISSGGVLKSDGNLRLSLSRDGVSLDDIQVSGSYDPGALLTVERLFRNGGGTTQERFAAAALSRFYCRRLNLLGMRDNGRMKYELECVGEPGAPLPFMVSPENGQLIQAKDKSSYISGGMTIKTPLNLVP